MLSTQLALQLPSFQPPSRPKVTHLPFDYQPATSTNYPPSHGGPLRRGHEAQGEDNPLDNKKTQTKKKDESYII